LAGNESTERINYFTEDTKQNNRSNLDEHVWQVDYVTKVNKVSIELGLKDTYRISYSDFTLSRLDSLTGSYLNDLSQANTFNHHQNILGAYNSYYLKLKYVGIKVGLRLERTDNDADFQSSNTQLNQGYFNVFPSLILQKLSKNGEQSFRIGYNMRLLRPGITLLNPFVDQSNPRNYISGNPYLLPVKTHNIDFAYSLTKKTSLVTSLTYSFSNNGIQQLSTLQPDSIILTSYQNVGKRDELTFNGNLNFPITKQFSLTANGNLAYVWLKGYFDSN
jgi:outer membrane receptor protein involved in Fe transport